VSHRRQQVAQKTPGWGTMSRCPRGLYAFSLCTAILKVTVPLRLLFHH
jgi:hypothetical protein